MKEKKCSKCGQVKPIGDFEENPYSPDGRYLMCRVCFKRLDKEPAPVPPKSGDRKGARKSPGVSGQKMAGGESKAPPQKRQKAAPEKPSEKAGPSGALNRDWALKDYADRRDTVSPRPKEPQRAPVSGEVLPRLRKCTGCKKIEVVEKTSKFSPTPVQAWFCDSCDENKRHQYVGKGYLVYDYWGRIYKITRVVNNEVVQGVVKKGDGRWSIRKFDILGRWRTKKPL